MIAISNDPIKAAKEFAASACLDWWAHEDGSLSVFHPDGAARGELSWHPEHAEDA